MGSRRMESISGVLQARPDDFYKKGLTNRSSYGYTW